MIRLLLPALLSLSAFAGLDTICGTRAGTAGNVHLVEDGQVVLTLASQGGKPALRR